MSGSRVRWRRAACLTSETRVAVTQWSLAIARDAYLFTYPLAMSYRTMSMQAIKGDRRFGKWLQLGRSDKGSTRLPAPNEAATRGGSSGVDPVPDFDTVDREWDEPHASSQGPMAAPARGLSLLDHA